MTRPCRSDTPPARREQKANDNRAYGNDQPTHGGENTVWIIIHLPGRKDHGNHGQDRTIATDLAHHAFFILQFLFNGFQVVFFALRRRLVRLAVGILLSLWFLVGDVVVGRFF